MVQLIYLACYDAIQRRARSGRPVPKWLATALHVPWVSVLSSIVAIAGWALWFVKSEAARRSTHGVVEGFGLSLVREPWPLWAPLPVSAALLPLLTVLLVAAVARERIQRRIAAGGTPFCDVNTSESGSESGSYTPSTRRGVNPRNYFLTAAVAVVAAWGVHAWLASLLVCEGVWAAAMAATHTATTAVQPYALTLGGLFADGTSSTAEMDWSSRAAAGLARAAAAALSSQSGRTSVSSSSSSSSGSGSGSASTASVGGVGGWGPWGPGGFCPPSCVDLSSYSRYLGDNTCCCNVIGGVFASEPHSAAATRSLAAAMAGLAVFWVGVSWLMLAAGCQFAHTESEALLCSGVTCAAAAQVGEPANQAAVQRLSSWIARRMGPGGAASMPGRAPSQIAAARDPLLGNESGGGA